MSKWTAEQVEQVRHDFIIDPESDCDSVISMLHAFSRLLRKHHPEDFCDRCWQPNVKPWFVTSDLWNRAHDDWSILCPRCFVELAEKSGIKCTGWELVPENLEITA